MEHDAEAFKAKLQAWREGEATLGVTWGGRNGHGGGRKDFHDSPSKWEKERKIVANAKAKGIAIERYDPNFKDKQLKK